MNKVLILYPELFKCYEKFERKVFRILSNLDDYTIITDKDHNFFIKKFCEKLSKSFHENRSHLTPTHAIIFDDGEEFSETVNSLRQRHIPTRLTKIKITRVINIKNDEKYKRIRSTKDYEYIGRGSTWGNPHVLYENNNDRNEVIRKFQYDFEYNKFINWEKEDSLKLMGKRLGCFCKPKSCHGDIIAEYLNSHDDGK